MRSLAQSISKAQQMISSKGAALLFLWMLADGKPYYTQAYIVQHYGIKKRSVRDMLYKLIDQNLITREYKRGSEPLYFPHKKNNPIANEPILTD